MHDWMPDDNPNKKVELSYVIKRYLNKMDHFVFVTNNIVELYDQKKGRVSENMIQQSYDFSGIKKEALFCNDAYLKEALDRLDNILNFRVLPLAANF
jgi:hypothetical protein